MVYGRIMSRVARVFVISFVKTFTRRGVRVLARGRAGFGPSADRISTGMIHTDPCTDAIIFASLSVNQTGSLLHEGELKGSGDSPTKASWPLEAPMSGLILVTTLWSSFGLLSIAPEPWGVKYRPCCASPGVNGAAA